MEVWHLIIFFFIVLCWYLGRRHIASQNGEPSISRRDLFIVTQSIQEGLACLGYSLRETTESRADAVKIGTAHIARGDAPPGPIAIAMGIAQRYADDNRLGEAHTQAIKHLVMVRYGELASMELEQIARKVNAEFERDSILGFLVAKSHKDSWTIAAQFRDSSVLRGMMFGHSSL